MIDQAFVNFLKQNGPVGDRVYLSQLRQDLPRPCLCVERESAEREADLSAAWDQVRGDVFVVYCLDDTAAGARATADSLEVLFQDLGVVDMSGWSVAVAHADRSEDFHDDGSAGDKGAHVSTLDLELTYD